MVDFIRKFKDKVKAIDKESERTQRNMRVYEGTPSVRTWRVYKIVQDDAGVSSEKSIMFGLTETEALKNVARMTKRAMVKKQAISFDLAPETTGHNVFFNYFMRGKK